jgi:hypothetical protein
VHGVVGVTAAETAKPQEEDEEEEDDMFAVGTAKEKPATDAKQEAKETGDTFVPVRILRSMTLHSTTDRSSIVRSSTVKPTSRTLSLIQRGIIASYSANCSTKAGIMSMRTSDGACFQASSVPKMLKRAGDERWPSRLFVIRRACKF